MNRVASALFRNWHGNSRRTKIIGTPLFRLKVERSEYWCNFCEKSQYFKILFQQRQKWYWNVYCIWSKMRYWKKWPKDGSDGFILGIEMWKMFFEVAEQLWKELMTIITKIERNRYMDSYVVAKEPSIYPQSKPHNFTHRKIMCN